jgi:tetratricopeptide (TPR) repeat protein
MMSARITVGNILLGAGILITALGTGCGGGESQPLPGSSPHPSPGTGSPSGDAAISQPPPSPAGETAVETGVQPALKLEGIGSKAELDRSLAKLESPEARAEFEKGFRVCFSHDRAHRDFDGAIASMEKVLAAAPNFPPAYRVLAYAYLNKSFDMPKATEYYEKAVAADPNYGEAHYALAFMLTQSDMARARTHFDKAMALGVPDERNLREQFFSN